VAATACCSEADHGVVFLLTPVGSCSRVMVVACSAPQHERVHPAWSSVMVVGGLHNAMCVFQVVRLPYSSVCITFWYVT
jgi:hypothetical protein